MGSLVVTAPRNVALLAMAAGFTIWLSALALLYAGQATGCELGWQHVRIGPIDLLRLALGALFALHMGALSLVLVYSRRRLTNTSPPEAFLWRASIGLTVAAAVATVWIGAALFLPSIC